MNTGRGLVAGALRAVRAAHPLHVVLVVVALLAWGSSGVVLLQRNMQQTLQARAQAAIRQGDMARALELYNQSLARYPWARATYSGRATALAWLALDDPQQLPAALEAQAQAARFDPRNPVVPVNRGALLLQMEQEEQAAALLQTFIEGDRSQWAAPAVLLARMYEQQGDSEQARAYWRMALRYEPAIAESAACLHSPICPTLLLPSSEYAALVEAENLLAQPDEAALQQAEEMAARWRSVDIWAVAALAAERAGDEETAQRFLTAAVEEAQNETKQPTMRLAIAQLHDAMQRGDRATVRSVARQWIAHPDTRVVPQVLLPLATTTELQLAQTLLEAARYLDDPALQAQAQHYAAWTQAALMGVQP